MEVNSDLLSAFGAFDHNRISSFLFQLKLLLHCTIDNCLHVNLDFTISQSEVNFAFEIGYSSEFKIFSNLLVVDIAQKSKCIVDILNLSILLSSLGHFSLLFQLFVIEVFGWN
jgi:hypothetical protein